MPANNNIGTLRESSLHAEIKNWYRQDGDLLEIQIGGYTIDILRGDLLIEVQTGNFSKLRNKLTDLLPEHKVRIVYPIAISKWVSRKSSVWNVTESRRRSPKKGTIYSLFDQLVFLVLHVDNPNYSLEVLLIEQEDIWIDDAKGSWRRNFWSILDRHLLIVSDRILFNGVDDYRFLLPDELDKLFSSRELSTQSGISLRLARKMLYCLLALGLIRVEGVKNRRRYYSRI